MQKGGSAAEIGRILKSPIIYQRGYGYRYPRRRNQQFGRGFGSALASLARYFQPLLVRGLKAVGREVLESGSDILTQIDQNKPLKQAVKDRADEAYKNLKRKAESKLEPLMKGGKRRCGGSKKKCKVARKKLKHVQRGKGIKAVRSLKTEQSRKRPVTYKSKKRVKDIFT